jgi:Ca2+-binding RTX toxin-like protein
MHKSFTIGRLTAAALFAGAALIIGVSTAFAAPPNWNTTGTYEVAFTCAVGCSGTYNHDLTLSQDGSGNLTGSGGNPVGAHVYNWVLTSGTVDANAIAFTANYTSTADAVTPQTTMVVNGTIASGSMSGTWTDNYQGGARSGTWSTVSGTATPANSAPACSADDTTFDTFALGSVNGQHGWSSTGPFDQMVVSNTYGYPTFGCKTLRISDAATSDSFGDQTFSYSVANEAGETGALNGGMSGGTRQNHFEAQFDLASALATLQPGMHVSVSPDRGDGARMSYLRFDDTANGIDVYFDDVQGTANPANFVETKIATISRAPHTIKFVMDFVDGASNDVVKVYIDGALVHTGTSWENYYRFDSESSAGNNSRTVDSLLFRESGDASPANAGKGFLIDNVSLSSSTVAPAPTTSQVTIVKYVDGAHATVANANGATFPFTATYQASNVLGGNQGSDPFTIGPVGNGTPNSYEAMTIPLANGAMYNATENTTGNTVVGATCAANQSFALNGYSSGDTMQAAVSGTQSSTSPTFNNLQGNKFVIVWNVSCAGTTTPPVTVPPANACATPGQAPAGYTLKNGTSGNDTAVLAPNTMYVGKGGNDRVSGGNGNYIVCTGAGNDVITLGDGNSSIDAGAGNNTVTVGNGEGSIKSGVGNDTVSAGNGVRTIDVGNGNNKVTSGDQAQTITAGSGNDEIMAGAGDDTVNAGSGNNKLWGEAGADMLTAAAGNDALDGGAGSDTCQAGGGNNTKASCEL